MFIMMMEHQASARRKLRSAIRQTRACPGRLTVPFFLMTDPGHMPAIISTITSLPAGCGVVYRHFGCPNRFSRAHELARLCASNRLVLLVSADPGLARIVGADGIHWPEARLGEAGRYRRQFHLQTASAHSRTAIWHAAHMGMDAVLVSPVFARKSEHSRQPIGPMRFRQLAKTAPLPLYALGGVDGYTARSIAGFGGLAAISGAIQAFSPS